jgi:hypothetical protein
LNTTDRPLNRCDDADSPFSLLKRVTGTTS